MRKTLFCIAVSAGAAMASASAANAAPAIGANPAPQSSAVQPVQEFGIYVGPRYYRDPYWGYGYGYRPYYSYYDGPRYYYGPRYYNGRGYYYGGGRRYFRQLERQAP